MKGDTQLETVRLTGVSILPPEKMLQKSEDPGMNDFFGFDDSEVGDMLEYYGLGEYREGVRRFYDGYRFGSRQAYNPWAVLEFASKVLDYLREGQLKGFANAVESLENRGEIKTQIVEQLTFDNMYETLEGLWTVMLHSGYLTLSRDLGDGFAMLRVPNEEVLKAFDDLVLQISQERIAKGDILKNACEAVESFDPARIEEALNAMLAYRGDWETESSAETGNGYCDIVVENDEGGPDLQVEIPRGVRGRPPDH